MIVLSQAMALAALSELSADNAVIGWRNVVTTTGLVADEALGDYPSVNLANPATHLLWKAETLATQYLTIVPATVESNDYVAIAGHNFGSGQVTVSVEGYIDSSWDEIFEETLLPNDDAVLLRYVADDYEQIRIKLQPDAVIPQAAVVYCGKLLVMERGIYAGHTPLSHARRSRVVTGRSESGNFLGRIVINEYRESAAKFRHLDPAWYRSYLDPFLSDGKDRPFFFAWRPSSYPQEAGYAWLTNDPMPTPDDQSHLIEVELAMQAVL